MKKPKEQLLCHRTKEEYGRKLEMTLRQWWRHHEKKIVFRGKCRWMGVKAYKNPLDAWIYQEIIHEIEPDVVIEIGSAEGGSTFYLANLLDMVGNGTVVSIDINRRNYVVVHDRIIAITGDSSSPETVARVTDLCCGKSVMVIHDGDHHKEQVLKDLEAYSGFVSVDSYFIVEDGINDLFRSGDGIGCRYEGPLVAIEEFLEKNPDFVVDEERERYILTYNPNGFLKRVS